jgi:hypothetical protein
MNILETSINPKDEWIRYYDNDHGYHYFQNIYTGETKWDESEFKKPEISTSDKISLLCTAGESNIVKNIEKQRKYKNITQFRDLNPLININDIKDTINNEELLDNLNKLTKVQKDFDTKLVENDELIANLLSTYDPYHIDKYKSDRINDIQLVNTNSNKETISSNDIKLLDIEDMIEDTSLKSNPKPLIETNKKLLNIELTPNTTNKSIEIDNDISVINISLKKSSAPKTYKTNYTIKTSTSLPILPLYKTRQSSPPIRHKFKIYKNYNIKKLDKHPVQSPVQSPVNSNLSKIYNSTTDSIQQTKSTDKFHIFRNQGYLTGSFNIRVSSKKVFKKWSLRFFSLENGILKLSKTQDLINNCNKEYNLLQYKNYIVTNLVKLIISESKESFYMFNILDISSNKPLLTISSTNYNGLSMLSTDLQLLSTFNIK